MILLKISGDCKHFWIETCNRISNIREVEKNEHVLVCRTFFAKISYGMILAILIVVPKVTKLRHGAKRYGLYDALQNGMVPG